MASHALATVTNPSAALTDFTLLVDLSDMPANWWSAVDTSDGTRGRVYKGDGSTRLACDWIDFDDTAETGLLRVKWTGTLATSGTQQLWIEPPVTTNATVAADDTYGSDNAYDDVIEAYWPLTSDANDRTVNGHDGTGETGITYGADTGLCGPATDFEGSYAINIGKPLGDVDFSLTVVFGSGSNTYRRILMAGNRHRTELCKWATSTELRLKPATTDECHTTIANNTAYFAQATIDINTGYSLRLNGGTAVTDTIEDEFDADIDWYIGRRSYSSEQYWDDWMQHAMLYNVLVSDDWADHEYAQIDDNATFWGSWSWVAAGGGLSINVADTITLAEALTPDQPLGPISLADTISITEALALLQDIMPDVFDGISLSEFVALLKDVVPSVADSVSISESVVVSMIGNLIASVSDSITVEEAVSLLADVVPGVADSISLSEFVALLKDIVPSVADTISVAEFVDIAGIGVAGAISIADTIAVAEAVSILADVVPVVYDGISIAEAVTLAKDINPSLFDEISVNEYVAVSMMLAVGRVTATITGRTPGTTITGRRPGTTITAS